MPTSARKSSMGGSRRGPQKYIPYHADDLQRGKRTGIAVGYVDRNSDEFEPFDQVIRQADLRTPPKPKMHSKKKRAPKTPVVDWEDEDGEMSMELEDSVPNSPTAYIASSRNGITSSVQRVGSSSRPVASRSDVDFDKIPSPRPISSSKRSNGRSSRPSQLSQASIRQDVDDDDSDFGGYDGGYDDGFEVPGPPFDDGSDNERTPVPRSKQQRLSSRPSFARMDLAHDEDEDEEARVEEEMEMTPTQLVEPALPARGRLSSVQEEDINMEDEVAQGLADVEMHQDFDEPPQDEQDMEPEELEQGQEQEVDEEEEIPQRGKGKGKGKAKGKAKGRGRDMNDGLEKDQRPSKRARKENGDEEPEPKKKSKKTARMASVLNEVVHDQNINHDDGVRRGTRMRYKPLEWWRLEKVVYGRRDSGQCLVPTIKEIHRLPKEEVQPLGAKHRRKRQTRSKSVTVEPVIEYNPEEGWDENTQSEGVVIDYETKEEVTRRVAYTAKMVHTKQAANADFAFQKIFGDSDFMAAGQLLIPPNGQKPTKGTKDNTFIFYLIEGAVTFKVHRTSYILTTGSMFLVPRGNQYYIRNISDRDAKLFFAQARKLPASERDDESESSRSPSKSRSRSGTRSSRLELEPLCCTSLPFEQFCVKLMFSELCNAASGAPSRSQFSYRFTLWGMVSSTPAGIPLPVELCDMIVKLFSLGSCHRTRLANTQGHNCQAEEDCTRRYVGCNRRELCQIALVCRRWAHLLDAELSARRIILNNRSDLTTLSTVLYSPEPCIIVREIDGLPDVTAQLRAPWIHTISLRLLPTFKLSPQDINLRMSNSGPFHPGQNVSSIHKLLPRSHPSFSTGIRTLSLSHVSFKSFAHLLRLIREMPSLKHAQFTNVSWNEANGIPSPTSFLARDGTSPCVGFSAINCTSDKAALWIGIVLGLTRKDALDSMDAGILIDLTLPWTHISQLSGREQNSIYAYPLYVLLAPREDKMRRRRVHSIAFEIDDHNWSQFDWSQIGKKLRTLGELKVVLVAFSSYELLCKHRNAMLSCMTGLKSYPDVRFKLAFEQDSFPQDEEWVPVSFTKVGVQVVGKPVPGGQARMGWTQFL
ncbi:hypothetical protein NM688_g4308 [Phlebia brevispora]|uniref:Uncharacterized protein n=1 Tax=Phlebia brevispora TaxID=194682 RepID=A0ACC1T307_9APHY|nr:hypothetical protein NM688_g4308 [Phlebia brevispora]